MNVNIRALWFTLKFFFYLALLVASVHFLGVWSGINAVWIWMTILVFYAGLLVFSIQKARLLSQTDSPPNVN